MRSSEKSRLRLVGEKVRRERRWTSAGATPARKVVARPVDQRLVDSHESFSFSHGRLYSYFCSSYNGLANQSFSPPQPQALATFGPLFTLRIQKIFAIWGR